LAIKDPIPVIIDTREKLPLFSDKDKDFIIINRKLDTGDYTIDGLESILVIERKANVNEMYGCFTTYRKRFFNEIERMMFYPLKFLIIGSNYSDIINPYSYRLQSIQKKKIATAITASSINHLVIKNHINVIFAGKDIKKATSQLLKDVYKYYLKGDFVNAK
jgi:hypothetical protein